jgi:integrase
MFLAFRGKGDHKHVGDEEFSYEKLGVDQFTPHDLRRTAATFMSQLGEHDEVIDAILNHAKKGIIATYNQNRYDREKQQALESWERKLQAIITGKGEDNVVSIGTAKGMKAA